MGTTWDDQEGVIARGRWNLGAKYILASGYWLRLEPSVFDALWLKPSSV